MSGQHCFSCVHAVVEDFPRGMVALRCGQSAGLWKGRVTAVYPEDNPGLVAWTPPPVWCPILEGTN